MKVGPHYPVRLTSTPIPELMWCVPLLSIFPPHRRNLSLLYKISVKIWNLTQIKTNHKLTNGVHRSIPCSLPREVDQKVQLQWRKRIPRFSNLFAPCGSENQREKAADGGRCRRRRLVRRNGVPDSRRRRGGVARNRFPHPLLSQGHVGIQNFFFIDTWNSIEIIFVVYLSIFFWILKVPGVRRSWICEESGGDVEGKCGEERSASNRVRSVQWSWQA